MPLAQDERFQVHESLLDDTIRDTCEDVRNDHRRSEPEADVHIGDRRHFQLSVIESSDDHRVDQIGGVSEFGEGIPKGS